MTVTTYSPNRHARIAPRTPPGVTLHVAVPADTRAKLHEIASRRRMKFAELLRWMLADGIERERGA